MKQYLIAIAMVLALSSNMSATAQKHRHTPRTEQVSDTLKHNQDAIEAFSDTTATADTNTDLNDSDSYSHRQHVSYEMDEKDAENIVKGVFAGLGGAAIIIPVLAILVFGLLLPILVLVLVFYFINRNRKLKYRLAQMAIQNGQPIPDQLLKEDADKIMNKGMYNDGIRQMFTGVGLAIFLSIIMGELGFGIGALVFFIGLGKYVIARQERKRANDLGGIDNSNTNNETL